MCLNIYKKLYEFSYLSSQFLKIEKHLFYPLQMEIPSYNFDTVILKDKTFFVQKNEMKYFFKKNLIKVYIQER